MGLKRHLIRDMAEHDRTGLTACNEPFFIGQTSSPSTGRFEAFRRIGGLEAVADGDFFPDPKTHCRRCISAWEIMP